MRTPGHDFELAVGYLFTEGILRSPGDLREVRYCTKGLGDGVPQEYNIATVELFSTVDPSLLRRATVTSSSCGLCGTDSIDNIASVIEPLDLADGARLTARMLMSLPAALRAKQPQFSKTGGLHGVGLFDPSGRAVVVREDVGRHNALDKLIGVLASGNMDTARGFALITSRASYEMVQKAAMAGIGLLAAVSAPTALAVRVARAANVTLAGFVRGERCMVYADDAHRLTTSDDWKS